MFSLPRIIIGGLAAIVLVVVVVVAGWWFLVREDAKLATEAPAIPVELVEATTGAAGAVDASDGLTFRIIAERSEAAYFAGEKLASLPLPSTAKGATTAIEGEFHLASDGFALDTSTLSTFTVDVTTLESNEDRRDSRVQQALETSTFPTVTFVAASVSGVDPSMAEGEEHTFQLTGTLDLHGVQREVVWEVQARREGNVMTALATTSFLFADFNITPPNIAGFVSVEDEVTLQVQIVAEAVA